VDKDLGIARIRASPVTTQLIRRKTGNSVWFDKGSNMGLSSTGTGSAQNAGAERSFEFGVRDGVLRYLHPSCQLEYRAEFLSQISGIQISTTPLIGKADAFLRPPQAEATGVLDEILVTLLDAYLEIDSAPERGTSSCVTRREAALGWRLQDEPLLDDTTISPPPSCPKR